MKMKFEDLLLNAIRESEIPLRFEPGAEEAIAKPVMAMLQAWIAGHLPPEDASEFHAGYRALMAQLLAELDGAVF